MLIVSMPKAVQIRDVPDDTITVLRARAAAAGMSMSEYLRGELIKLAGRPTVEEVLSRAGRRATGDGPSKETVVAVIREMRGE